MPRRRVESTACVGLSADQLWAHVRDFCAPWHPLVREMRAEIDSRGGLRRVFSVEGDAGAYVERLTFYSDSLREMAYTHVSGIAGVGRYDGRLRVVPDGSGARVTMAAEFEAEGARADAIADGTQQVFDLGVAALARLRAAPALPDPEVGHVPTETRILDGPPRLGLTVTPTPHDTLCLFLHGIGGNRSNWDAQLPAVAHCARAAALDLRGYGDSALGDAQTTVDDYCADILRVVGALDAKRLILCGLSYGAWIATSFAVRHPEHLAGLVLSGGCTGMSEAAPEERAAFRAAREAPLDAGQAPADFAPQVVEIIAGPSADATVRDALQRSMAQIAPETYRDAVRCFTHPPETFDFARLSMPVLLITGAHDALAPPAEIQSVARRICDASPTPDVRFEVLPDAGHVCNLETPAAYNAILRDFVGRVAQAG